MRIFNSLAVLAAAGWAGSAAAQSVLSSIPLTAVGTGFGTAIAGPMMGYAKGNIYTCSSGGDNVVWKVATGNGDGPSETATMSNINYLTLPNNCYFGVVSGGRGLKEKKGGGERDREIHAKGLRRLCMYVLTPYFTLHRLRGQVDSNGFGYWILDSYTEIAKTSGNEGSADMVGQEATHAHMTDNAVCFTRFDMFS